MSPDYHRVPIYNTDFQSAYIEWIYKEDIFVKGKLTLNIQLRYKFQGT